MKQSNNKKDAPAFIYKPHLTNTDRLFRSSIRYTLIFFVYLDETQQ